MKKKRVMIVTSLLVGVFAVAFFLKIAASDLIFDKQIALRSWNTSYEDYVVCKAVVFGGLNYGCASRTDSSVDFDTITSLDKMVASNKEDYVGKFTFYDLFDSYSGRLFFRDNNYYMICNGDTEGIYWAQNCFLTSSIGYTEEQIVPSPVSMDISYETFQWEQEYGLSEFDVLFEHYDYKKAKEFYKHLSSDYVIFKDDTQEILLDSYGYKLDTCHDQYLTMNFKDKTITLKTSDGEFVTVDGTEEAPISD